MSEEKLEIIEKRIHREGNADAIQLAQEVRRLQTRVSELAATLRVVQAMATGEGGSRKEIP